MKINNNNFNSNFNSKSKLPNAQNARNAPNPLLLPSIPDTPPDVKEFEKICKEKEKEKEKEKQKQKN